jgi:hypothetical protein
VRRHAGRFCSEKFCSSRRTDSVYLDARCHSEGFVNEGFVQKVLFRRFCTEGFVQKGFVYNDAVIWKKVTMYCVQLHERSTSTHVSCEYECHEAHVIGSSAPSPVPPSPLQASGSSSSPPPPFPMSSNVRVSTLVCRTHTAFLVGVSSLSLSCRSSVIASWDSPG